MRQDDNGNTFLLKDSESQVDAPENSQSDKFQEILLREILEAAKRKKRKSLPGTYNKTLIMETVDLAQKELLV